MAELATTNEPSKRIKRIDKLTLQGENVEGLEDLTLGDKVWIEVEAEVLSLGKNVYSEEDREKPPEAEFEIISAKVKTTLGKKMNKMREATNYEELKKAFEGED